MKLVLLAIYVQRLVSSLLSSCFHRNFASFLLPTKQLALNSSQLARLFVQLLIVAATLSLVQGIKICNLIDGDGYIDDQVGQIISALTTSCNPPPCESLAF